VFPDALQSALQGIWNVSPEQGHRLASHYELLKKWNRVLNLTRIEGLEEAIERHYCESLFLAAHLPAEPLAIADIGSGAGFPGVPLAVVREDCQVTLIESHQRKAVFLKEATRDLPNVRVLAKRAEEVDECFDWGVVRAVRWDEISWILGRLVRSAAVLSGEGPGAAAAACFKMPWGRERYLWMFHVKHARDVSRETGQ
jgi:16S rRNA (guanine(527)-N(7))-methyltransferase RsmG